MKYKFQYSLLEMTKRLFHYAKPIRFYLVISTLASIIGNLSHMGLMGFGALWILSSGGYVQKNPSVYMALTIVSAVLIPVCRYLEGVFSHIGAYGILAGMRVYLFQILDRIAPAYMTEVKQGDLLNIAVSDIETLEFFFAHTIGPMFTVILLPLTTLIIAAHYDPLYAWILFPLYLIISVILPLTALKAGRAIGMRFRKALGTLKALILESVYGLRDVQIFGYGRKREETVMGQNDVVNKAAHGMILHGQIVSSLPNFFVYLARILIIAGAVYLRKKGIGDPVGTIVVSFVAAASFSSTFSLTFVVSHLLEAYAAAERFFLLEDTLPAVEESKDAKEVSRIETIEFDHVRFRYPRGGNDVLKDINTVIHQGERLGICGESGIGKSTLLRLLFRFYDPDGGAIKINGDNLKEVSFSSLYQRMAMLEQDTYLYDGTIRENIALGRPDADDEMIETAARRAGIDAFIRTLPDGYDTEMGLMGARLSGGERQRIGIARVLLKDPDIILMDEPSSALDVFHERELLYTMKQEYHDKTVLIISHRLSTLAFCDSILRLENGELTLETMPALSKE